MQRTLRLDHSSWASWWCLRPPLSLLLLLLGLLAIRGDPAGTKEPNWVVTEPACRQWRIVRDRQDSSCNLTQQGKESQQQGLVDSQPGQAVAGIVARDVALTCGA